MAVEYQGKKIAMNVKVEKSGTGGDSNIDTISLNGVNIPPDSNKNVDIEITKNDVGLGNVVNAGMDETPTENSDNYVKSGGAKKYVDDELTPVKEKITDLNSKWQTTSGRIASHTSDKNNPHEVTKAQVGLGNVDNTADADKPVSTAQQAAIDEKLDKPTNAGTAGQVLTKTASGSEWKDADADGNIVIKKTVPTFPESGGGNIIINFTAEEQNAIKTTPEKVVLEIATTTETKVLSPSSITSANIYFSTSVRSDTYYYLVYITSADKGQFGRYDIETGGGETYVYFTSTIEEPTALSSGDLNELTNENNDNVIIVENDVNADDITIYRRCAAVGNSYWFVSIYTENAIPPETADAFKMAVKVRQVDKTNSILSERFSSGLATSSQLSKVNKSARKYEHRITSRVMVGTDMMTVTTIITTSDANAYSDAFPTRVEYGYPCIVSYFSASGGQGANVLEMFLSSGAILLRGILVYPDGKTVAVTSSTSITTITLIASDTVTQI